MLSHAFKIEFCRFMAQKLSNGCDNQASQCKSPGSFSLPETPWAFKGLLWAKARGHTVSKRHPHYLQERTNCSHNLPLPLGQPIISVTTSPKVLLLTHPVLLEQWLQWGKCCPLEGALRFVGMSWVVRLVLGQNWHLVSREVMHLAL